MKTKLTYHCAGCDHVETIEETFQPHQIQMVRESSCSECKRPQIIQANRQEGTNCWECDCETLVMGRWKFSDTSTTHIPKLSDYWQNPQRLDHHIQ